MAESSAAMDHFARNVRHLMSHHGLSQRGLAHRAGMYEANINRILTGKEGVTLERAEKIADALGVSLSMLVSEKIPKIAKSAVLAIA